MAAFRTRTYSDSGYTLMEVMVALSVIGLLLVALFGGVRFGTAVWARAAAETQSEEQVRLARDFLRRQLANAYPHLTSNVESSATVSFEGERDGIRFISTGVTVDGLQIRSGVDLKLRPNPEAEPQEDLVASVAPRIFGSSSGAAAGVEEVLLTGLEAARFSYLDYDTEDQPGGWVEEWQQKTRLPRLIRFTAVEAGTPLPDLIVKPWMAGDVSCRIDPRNGGCRGQ